MELRRCALGSLDARTGDTDALQTMCPVLLRSERCTAEGPVQQ
jgi:hypothetical protein